MQPEELFINIPDKSKQGFHKIAYTRWGNKDNPKVLLCMHGLSRNGRDFDFLAQELCNDYQVIAVDVAGRGRSQWLEDKDQYNYVTYTSDIFYLLGILGIDKVDWVGTSMGGIIAMLMGAYKPDLINKLVLNDIGTFVPGEALERIFDYVGKTALFDSRTAAERILKARMSSFGTLSEEHWQHIFKYSVIEIAGGKFSFAYDPQIIKKPSFWQRLKGINIKKPKRWLKMPDVDLLKFWEKIQCPVLILRGEVSDILHKDTADKMMDGRDDVKLVEIKNTGHAPMLMDKEQISIVKSWLLDGHTV